MPLLIIEDCAAAMSPHAGRILDLTGWPGGATITGPLKADRGEA